ncbi:SPOR domain-containing protein [Arenibacterium halophilum]|uniref:SPOR domain-containing protein n=1 Tax=Arenibacterium halophilum TaxID=2583821 RepID=A0ABY2X934_9RHOB|nr:SPOR domain-containing protein [Arenibacterium halophilum]TMV12886.1 SPOR domain-containing protein [Arenibacterium halophilum]
MRVTRIIAIILGLGWAFGAPVTAQTLRDAGPPAEFPPASYTGKQYVDSKGCVYIRAGIDGSVTWVPRVTRQRKLLCGQVPSLSPDQLARAGSAPARPAPPDAVEITLTPGQATATPARPAATPAPAPRTPSAAPEPTVIARPAPVRTAPRAQPAQPTTVRVQPVAPAPRQAQAATALAPSTRIVPRHIYENRQNTRGGTVPKGYRKSWDDDRLNPYRGERTAAPSGTLPVPRVPKGYRPAWDDDRLNPNRGPRTAQGEAATDAIWTRTVPRELIQEPTRGHVRRIPNNARNGNSPFWEPPARATVAQPRVSTRSEPVASTGQAFVRVAVYRAEAQARTAAQSLVKTGMTLRLGTLRHKGETLQVVVAGPFPSQATASAAVGQLRAAGFSNAQLRRTP